VRIVAPSQPFPSRPASVKARSLGELCLFLNADPGPASTRVVTGVTHDSRAVRRGDLFAALPGARAHGATFSAAAVASGAVAVLTDAQGARLAGDLPVPVLTVADPRSALGPLAALVYGEPSAHLTVFGVTGTNGKTTTCYLIEAGLRAAGWSTGLIGTVAIRVAGRELPTGRTTPEATDLQALLGLMREQGVAGVAMEVSSHALALRRVDGTAFAVTVFTNLSQDHLDFHQGMEEYYLAKARLFSPVFTTRAVVDVDDAAGARLAAELRAAGEVAVSTVAENGPADFRLDEPRFSAEGGQARLTGPDGFTAQLAVRLPGPFNLRNAACAVAALVVAGVPADQALAGVGELAGVPGRLEPVRVGQPFAAIVDYAHTPEALARVLAAVRAVTAGRVLVVVGCGGDRDRGKRPMMAAAAAGGADEVFLTSDNPRSEDPERIIDDMLTGLPAPSAARVEVDRRVAIRRAVAAARPGDAVVVAGKGHETGQIFAGRTEPFDDRQVLAEEIAAARAPESR
jgi:UDP-N-acetylmuramoyl-L-alanyl-D-glutamate--2,6-diaminopimelate ligase